MNDLLRKIPLLLVILFILGPIIGRNGLFLLLIVLIIYLIFKQIPNLKLRDITKPMAKTIDVDKLMSMNKARRVIVLTVLFIFAAWLFFASIQIVDAGETGVYSLFGKVKDQELKSGFHLVIPLAKVTRMSVRTEEYTMSIAQGEGQRYDADAITSLTKEGLSVNLDMTVLYRLQEDKASDVYRELGLKYDEKIIRPAIRTSIRDIIAQYEAKDIYSEKRQEAAD